MRVICTGACDSYHCDDCSHNCGHDHTDKCNLNCTSFGKVECIPVDLQDLSKYTTSQLLKELLRREREV